MHLYMNGGCQKKETETNIIYLIDSASEFSCDKCKKTFSSQTNLNTHRKFYIILNECPSEITGNYSDISSGQFKEKDENEALKVESDIIIKDKMDFKDENDSTVNPLSTSMEDGVETIFDDIA